jgi:DNA-binding Xre family transcriptional regulator
MIIKTRIFELIDGKYKNLSELAQAMGISVSQIYRVKEGKRSINQKFIIGAIKAFPKYKLDDLFYFVPQAPTGVTTLFGHRQRLLGKRSRHG